MIKQRAGGDMGGGAEPGSEPTSDSRLSQCVQWMEQAHGDTRLRTGAETHVTAAVCRAL